MNEIIWQVLASIPKGKVASYGHIAKLCGYPGHARYVGHTLKQLPEDTGLPWHRVINSKGQISFAKGTDAYQRQRTRLEQEGIVFKGDKISLKRFQWDGIPDESEPEC